MLDRAFYYVPNDVQHNPFHARTKRVIKIEKFVSSRVIRVRQIARQQQTVCFVAFHSQGQRQYANFTDR